MTSAERRERILACIAGAPEPLSGGRLAQSLGVSRQVIVQDIALLKAAGNEIISTSRGYVLRRAGAERVFKTVHTDEQIAEELNAIVDLGGTVKDVFVWHRTYGKIVGELNIRTRADVGEFLESLRSGRSSPLKNITSGYHYHTVLARDETALNQIEKALAERGFLVKE